MCQEKLQTMIMQNFGAGEGGGGCKRGVLWDCASSELAISEFPLVSLSKRV